MKKLRIDYVFLNLAMFASVLSLFVGGLPLKLLAVLLTFFYSVSCQHTFLMAHRCRFLWFAMLPIAIGLFFSSHNASLDVLRDVFFFSIPYVFCLAGITMRMNEVDYQAIMSRFASSYCILFIFFSFYYYFLLGDLDVQIIRDFVSPGSFLLLICIIFLYRDFTNKFLKLPLFWLAQIIFLVQSSRTYSIIIFVFFIFMKKNYGMSRMLLYISLLAMLLAFGWIVLFDLPDMLSADALQKVYVELNFKDVWTEQDMGTSYRAFETFSAYVAFSSYGFFNMLLGGGFGTLVPLDIPVVLAGKEYSAVPWMHNGYMFLLVKTGVAGMASYGVFFFLLLRNSFSMKNSFYAQMMRLTVAALLLANIVICGMFSLEFVFAYIFLGYCYSETFLLEVVVE